MFASALAGCIIEDPTRNDRDSSVVDEYPDLDMDGLTDDSQNGNQQTPEYHAEETQIQLFDDIAVVAFKLVAITWQPRGEERMEFYNTGTFQKRNDQWKAVAWQATRILEE